MSGAGDLALGAAPVAGGVALTSLLGSLKKPDLRAAIKADIELLERIPEDDAGLRAELKRTIDSRVEELVESVERSQQLRLAAGYDKANSRDIVVFVCALLFTVVWWYVPHSTSNWLIAFVCLLTLSALLGWSAARGLTRVARHHPIRAR